jgi:hypothetical protein
MNKTGYKIVPADQNKISLNPQTKIELSLDS